MSERPSIGDKRLEYLDLSNKCIAAGDYNQAMVYVENFLATIREGSDVSKEIQKAFDTIEIKKNETWLQVIKETEKIDQWQQTEVRAMNQNNLAAQVIKDKKDACWEIAMRLGAFND